MAVHYVPKKFERLSFKDMLKSLGGVLPTIPQPKWNPWAKTTNPGHIKFAALAIGGTEPNGAVYRFSKTKVLPLQKAPSDIESLANAVAKHTGTQYDIVLVNLYESVPPGVQKIGSHLDNESIMDTTVPITSVTLTEDKRYKARFYYHADPRWKKYGPKEIVPLGHGDLLTAPLGMLYHGVLPDTISDTRNVASVRRICFTFRKLKEAHLRDICAPGRTKQKIKGFSGANGTHPKPARLPYGSQATMGLWVCGPSASEHPDAYMKESNQWWDGYNGQDVVVVKDPSPKWRKAFWGKLWGWVREDPFRTRTKKGGIRYIRFKKMIVYCNSSPQDYFKDVYREDKFASRFVVQHVS